MRTAPLALAVLLLAGAALAQTADGRQSPPPDYSREKLRQIFSNTVEAPDHDRNIEFTPGAVLFKALGMRWRINCLPLLAPLPGSFRTTTGYNVDPFALTGTEIAQTPRTFAARRAISAEMKRIERTEKAKKAKVVVKP